MRKSRFAGLKIITVFNYRGMKCYIRGRGTTLEQLIISKPFFFSDAQLHTHYYEYSSIRRGEPYQEEQIRAMQQVHELVRMTVDEILTQRTFKVEVATWCNRLLKDVQQAVRLSFKRFRREWANRASPRLPARNEESGNEGHTVAEQIP